MSFVRIERWHEIDGKIDMLLLTEKSLLLVKVKKIFTTQELSTVLTKQLLY